MIPAELLPILLFACVAGGVMALAWLVAPSRDRVAERLRRLAGAGPRKASAGLVSRLAHWSFSRIASSPNASDPSTNSRS